LTAQPFFPTILNVFFKSYARGKLIRGIDTQIGALIMGTINKRVEETQQLLPPLLDEFRAALQDEIEVAKRNVSNRAIPLSNGHKVGQQGSAFQYAFLIDSVLNTPDGTLGDIVVPGKAPVEATIVSVEGLRIVISVETDLGKFVPSARLQTNLTFLMRKLIERIETNAATDNFAASRMLNISPVSGTPIKPKGNPSLNHSQMQALESALGRNLTVIWGPPGTGKTHTIGTIAEHLNKLDRTVLIVSHTNTAVDQAIKHVAKAMSELLEEGTVIRIGEVRDEELKSDFPDVLLKRQVERQSEELVKLRDNLSSQKQARSDELNDIQHKIDIIEWLSAVKGDIESSREHLNELHREEENLRSTKEVLSELDNKHAQLLQVRESASKILTLRRNVAAKHNDKSKFESLLSDISLESEDINRKINEQKSRLEIAKRITPLRTERATYPSLSEQKSIIETLSAKIVETEEKLRNIQLDYSNANEILELARNTGGIMRLWKRLPNPEDQKILVSSLSKKAISLDAELIATQTAYSTARNKLARILELDGELSRYESIGSYAKELENYRHVEHFLLKVEEKKSKIRSDLERICNEINELEGEEKEKAKNIDGDVNDIYLEVCSQLQQREELQDSVKSICSRINELRNNILSTLSTVLSLLPEMEELLNVPSEVEEIVDLVCEIHHKLSSQYDAINLKVLKEQVDSLSSEIHRLAGEIASVDEQLAQVERRVIANASIVGATLTKTYLSDDIQSRKFDTVILDEASMAPIPALWAAALLSENNLIIVGDFKQLPPIVLSSNELTKKWLGRDIFEASGIKELWNKKTPPDYFIQLNEQRRMLPEIAEVANLFYGGSLLTSRDQPKGIDEFYDWYNMDWAHDNSVTLIDTGDLNAWVTSVVKNANSSRLNFLSATVAVDLAEQLLLPSRPKREEGTSKRILIVAPYRAHAKLVGALLRENSQLQDEVIAGTVHSFQGCEADTVIFDLVVDEPLFKKVNLFTPTPLWNERIERLMNVGLTRAKFRLFIIGNFSYCQSKGKKAFLGRILLPFLLKSFPRVNVSQLFPNGLAAKAAKAQMTMLGGEIEPSSERIVVTQADFFRILSSDFSRARSRIVVYSPFMTQDRIAFLMPQLQAASSRGVEIFVITKSHSERSKSELAQIRKIETHLSGIGIIILHKMRMHEKLVFIDDDITWAGSLNPLSFSNTQEIMERRKSKAVLQDYFQILRLRELLSVPGNPESKCPIHGTEMVAAEGADQPYYWRCIHNGCYTRGIDQLYPFDGVLKCGTCNSPVEFGYWGNYPHWRCTANNRHRQKIFKSHLRLPKMAALVPKKELRRLCKILRIDDSLGGTNSERAAFRANGELGLFDTLE
jgi:superfamily I DNA and/or RNA helicase